MKDDVAFADGAEPDPASPDEWSLKGSITLTGLVTITNLLGEQNLVFGRPEIGMLSRAIAQAASKRVKTSPYQIRVEDVRNIPDVTSLRQKLEERQNKNKEAGTGAGER